MPQVKWTQTTINKLLLEAGISYYTQGYEQNCKDTVGPRDLPRLEQSNGRLTVACGRTIPPYTSWTKSYSSAASASYITGSHAFKAGMTMGWGTNSRTFSSNAQINTLVFNAGLLGVPASATNPVPCTSLPCPIAVVVENTPATAEQKVKSDLGFFVQDTWTFEPSDAERRRALRSLQCRSAGAVLACADLAVHYEFSGRHGADAA